MNEHPRPPFPKQRRPMPGATQGMQPRPDHGETSYKGSGKLAGLKAVITGGDSGIGRAVAIAFAREGADLLIAYLNEEKDAKGRSAGPALDADHIAYHRRLARGPRCIRLPSCPIAAS